MFCKPCSEKECKTERCHTAHFLCTSGDAINGCNSSADHWPNNPNVCKSCCDTRNCGKGPAPGPRPGPAPGPAPGKMGWSCVKDAEKVTGGVMRFIFIYFNIPINGEAISNDEGFSADVLEENLSFIPNRKILYPNVNVLQSKNKKIAGNGFSIIKVDGETYAWGMGENYEEGEKVYFQLANTDLNMMITFGVKITAIGTGKIHSCVYIPGGQYQTREECAYRNDKSCYNGYDCNILDGKCRFSITGPLLSKKACETGILENASKCSTQADCRSVEVCRIEDGADTGICVFRDSCVKYKYKCTSDFNNQNAPGKDNNLCIFGPFEGKGTYNSMNECMSNCNTTYESKRFVCDRSNGSCKLGNPDDYPEEKKYDNVNICNYDCNISYSCNKNGAMAGCVESKERINEANGIYSSLGHCVAECNEEPKNCFTPTQNGCVPSICSENTFENENKCNLGTPEWKQEFGAPDNVGIWIWNSYVGNSKARDFFDVPFSDNNCHIGEDGTDRNNSQFVNWSQEGIEGITYGGCECNEGYKRKDGSKTYNGDCVQI